MRTVRHWCAFAVVTLTGMSKGKDQSEDSGQSRAEGPAAIQPPPPALASSGSALVAVKEAAMQLGVKPTTLYDWLGQSDRGQFVIRGQPTSIRYFQSGPQGGGRIMLELEEIHRLRELMRVRPNRIPKRRPPLRKSQFPGITVPLGRPNGPA